MRRIYSMDTVPDTYEKWCKQALHFKHVTEKANEIVKGKGGNPFRPQYNPHRNNEQKSPKWDPNAMDVDNVQIGRLTNEERQKCRNKGSASGAENQDIWQTTAITHLSEKPDHKTKKHQQPQKSRKLLKKKQTPR